MVALYARVSGEEQQAAGTIDNQRQFAHAWAQLNEATLAREYLDDGITSALPLPARPGGAQLLADIRAGAVQHVVVCRADRLGRGPTLLSAVEAIERAGGTVRSLTEPIDTSTPAGRLFLTLLAGFSGYERDVILQRAREGQRRKARQGGVLGGKTAWGYRIEGRTHTAQIVLDDRPAGPLGSAAETARWIFHQLAYEGASAMATAQQLTALGVPAPQGGTWAPATVARMIRNPAYQGRHRYGDNPERPDDSLVGLWADIPPIVDEQTWALAQRRLDDNRRLPRRAGRSYLLRGLIWCGQCGGSYTGQTWDIDRADATDNAEGVRYRCNERARRQACDGGESISGRIEQQVWELCQSLVAQPALLATLLAAPPATHEPQPDPQERLSELAAQRERILALYRRGRISQADVDVQLDDIAAQEALVRRVGRTRPALPPSDHEERVRHVVALMQHPLSRPVQRRIIEAIVERVIVHSRRGDSGSVEIRVRLVRNPLTRDCNTDPEGQLNLLHSMAYEWPLSDLERQVLRL